MNTERASAPATAATRDIPIDWEALEDAFENNAPEVHSYLHTTTGDVLRVEILSIDCDDFGATEVIPGFGLLAAEFPDPFLVTWGLRDGAATSGRVPGIRVPADPFLGVIGVETVMDAITSARSAGAEQAPPSPLGENTGPVEVTSP